MLDLKWIRENKDAFNHAMARRNLEQIYDKINQLDESRRQTISLIQRLRTARNEKTKQISEFSDHTSYEYIQAKKDAHDMKEKISELENAMEADTSLDNILANIPNIVDDEVPTGTSDADNKEIRRVGNIREFDFEPLQHFELGEKLGLMEVEQTVLMSGSRFVTLKKDLAKLERALVNFMLDVHTKEFGFEEMSPPVMVLEQAMYNAGLLPKFEEDSFKLTSNYRLIPTAEVPLVNMVANKILKEEELPLHFTAFTNCFRSEAGSAGRDTRGLIRLHQFNKVELVSICKAENSAKEHELILSAAEEILKRLEIPYRVMLLSTGDLGFCSSKTYDLEVWLPSRKTYREISSCSNCTDFQARRLKARYKNKSTGENELVHTLNGSGLAVGRTIVAILENYQQKDGSILIPKVLQPYMNQEKIGG